MRVGHKKNDRNTILISTTTSTTHDFRKRKTLLFPIMEIVKSETILVSKIAIAKKAMFKDIDLDRKTRKRKHFVLLDAPVNVMSV